VILVNISPSLPALLKFRCAAVNPNLPCILDALIPQPPHRTHPVGNFSSH